MGGDSMVRFDGRNMTYAKTMYILSLSPPASAPMSGIGPRHRPRLTEVYFQLK